MQYHKTIPGNGANLLNSTRGGFLLSFLRDCLSISLPFYSRAYFKLNCNQGFGFN